MTTSRAKRKRQLVRDQFLAKLQRKKRTSSEKNARDFETRGMSPEAFIRKLRGCR
jgi:type I restriction enzyme, R subunit